MKRLVIITLFITLAATTTNTNASTKQKPQAKPILWYIASDLPYLADFQLDEMIYQEQLAEQAAAAAAQQAQEEADAARAAEEEATRQRQTSPQVQIQQPSVMVVVTGGCCGPHSDAWWQGVAMCEQGGRNDPYFGYFSFMDGSQGGRAWADQVAAGNALLARAGKEIGPWAASCVAAGYNSSPGG